MSTTDERAVRVCPSHDAACGEVPQGLRCEACPLRAALSAAPAEPAQIGTVEIVGGRVRSYSFEQTDVPTGEYRMCVATPSPQPAAKRPNCRDVPPGNGFCDMCAAGHYERCRYVVPLSQSAAIERLTEDQRMTLRDVIADSLGSTAYFCTRVWEAWNVGTMSRDDFHPITEDNDALLHIVDVVEAALYPRVIERELSRVPEGPEIAYATGLAKHLHAKHFPHVTQWKPLPDLLGLLTQIDNMMTGFAVAPTPGSPS